MTKIKSYKKQGNTYYRFKAYLGINSITGKKKNVSRSGFTSRRQAKIELDRLKYDFEHSSSWSNSNITFGEVYDMWIKSYATTVVESTLNRVTGIFRNHVLNDLGDKPIAKFDVRFCQHYIDDLATKLKVVRKAGVYINAVFKHAMRLGFIEKNPMALVIYPRTHPKQSDNFWNKEQLQQFLQILDSDYTDQPMLRTYFKLSAFTAARKGEILCLQWHDVNLKEKSIRINKTITRGIDNSQKVGKAKTANSNRIIYLNDATVDLLKDWKKQQRKRLLQLGFNITIDPSQLLFSNQQNRFLSLMTPNHWLNDIIQQYGLKRTTPHGLRHTVATLLSQTGISVKAIQLQLGDSDASLILNTYTHLDESIKKETTEKFSDFLQS